MLYFSWDIKLSFAKDTVQINLEQLTKLNEKLMSDSAGRMINVSYIV